MEVTCDKCDWTKTYRTQSSAKAGLAMHVGRMHGKIKIKGGKRKIPKKYKKYVKSVPVSAEMLNLSFCPGCGMNLRVLNQTIMMATRIANAQS